MATARNSLQVDTIYYVQSQEQYFVTPDGFGGYWYDTREEAFSEHGEQKVITIQELED
jgi:hypothetical protein